jgi:hypothetical protein
MDESEQMARTYRNLMQIDDFHTSEEYRRLIELTEAGTTKARKNAEIVLDEIRLLDESVMFYSDKHMWDRCYEDSVSLIKVLNKYVSTEYKPL